MDDRLIACLMDVERHVSSHGWDQPARLFALVTTSALLEVEPQLRGRVPEASPDALTAIEQDEFTATDDALDRLAGIYWPASVEGCAIAMERAFLPPEHEADIPADPDEAAEFVAKHPPSSMFASWWACSAEAPSTAWPGSSATPTTCWVPRISFRILPPPCSTHSGVKTRERRRHGPRSPSAPRATALDHPHRRRPHLPGRHRQQGGHRLPVVPQHQPPDRLHHPVGGADRLVGHVHASDVRHRVLQSDHRLPTSAEGPTGQPGFRVPRSAP